MKAERVSICICLLVTLLTGTVASAADAIILSSFGSGHSIGRGGALTADGRLVAFGYHRNIGDDFGMTRHTSDGFLDTSLNGSGMVTTDVFDDDRAYTLEIQPDGKIILGGICVKRQGSTSTGYLAMVRYLEGGSLDTSFGKFGIATKDFGRGTVSSVRDIVLQSDERIVVVGNTNAFAGDQVVVARYTTSGIPDPSFGSDGYVVTDLGPGPDSGSGIAMQGTKILVTGNASVSGGYSDVGLIRYNSNGSLDTSFGSGGIVKTDLGASDPDEGRAVRLQPDGKILVAGYTNENNGYANFGLVRYWADGTLDTTFGGGSGYVVTDVGINDKPMSVALQADGKILVAGSSYADPYEDGVDGPMSVVRYDSWGNLDTLFGMGGIRTVWISDRDQCYDVDVQLDGTIVLFGDTSVIGGSAQFAIVRLNELDGSLAGDDVLLPAVHTWLKLEQAPYDLGSGEDTAFLKVRVRNEYGDAITGLDFSAFATKLDGADVFPTYTESSDGVYEGTVDVSDLAEGTHTLETIVTDSRNLVGKYLVHFGITSPPVPAVHVLLATDQSVYNVAQGETTAVLTAFVTDENDEPITGLGAGAFATLLDGANATVDFVEIGGGIYAGDLDLTGLEDGAHVADVTVTDSRDVSGSDSVGFDTTSTSSLAIHVASISYSMGGGRDGTRNLYVTVEIQGDQWQPVSGASVSADVYLDGLFLDSYSAATQSDGRVTFQVKNAPSGDYDTDVTSVSGSGSAWDPTADALDPGYTKP